MKISGANIVPGRMTNVRVHAVLKDTGGRGDADLTFGYVLKFDDADDAEFLVLDALQKSVVAMGGGYRIVPRDVTVTIGQVVSDQGWR